MVKLSLVVINIQDTLHTDFNIDMTVVTMADGLEHNYFSYITWLKDNASPVGTATLVTAYIPHILRYWNAYDNVVILSAKLENNHNNTNTEEYYSTIVNAHYQVQDAKHRINDAKYKRHHTKTPLDIPRQRLINTDYNYSFIGKIDKVKQRGTEILITLKDIGWKFTQHVPKDFRDNYIADQYLDDAFQSMCEFLEVDFAYSIETLHEYKFASDGYSVTKDNETIENVPNTIQNLTESDNIKAISDSRYTMENDDLNEYNKKKEQTQTNTQNATNEATSIASSVVNQVSDKISTNQNNNTEDTGIDEKVQLYKQEFHEKIRDLFIGNSYYDSNLVSNVMNYDAITKTSTNNTNDSQIENIDDKKENKKDDKQNKTQSNQSHKTYKAKNISQLVGLHNINASDQDIIAAGKKIFNR